MSDTRPLKFSEATLVPDRKIQQPICQSPACIEAAESFTANIERSDRLSVVPGYAFLRGEYWCESMAEARGRTENPDESDADFFKRAERIYSDIYQTKSAEEARDELHRAKSNVEITLSRIPFFRHALSAILEAMIIQAWTAYESMSEDLHKGARLHHPTRFTPALAADDRYRFRTEDSLISAYKLAFNDAAISAAVWNSESKALAMLRHLLIHKRGIVDAFFIRQCAGQNRQGAPIGTPVVTDFLAYNDKDEIPIDGPFARSLIDRLAVAGYELISVVDDWLK